MRDSLSVAIGVIALAALGAFLYWYWSPGLPIALPILRGSAPAARPALDATAAASPQPVASPSAAPARVLAPFCPPGQPARFVLGFASLKARLGETMGEPVECEHTNPENGDVVQQTTTGLAVYRASPGELEFTDGYRHWALRGEEMVAWEGDTPPPR
jgi:hypothetical protein